MLELATKVLRDYGKTLGQVREGFYGLPESLLPHSKELIRLAIRRTLDEVDDGEIELREGLIHGYVYLAQFIPDEQYAIVERGQSAILNGVPCPEDCERARHAMRIINRVKLDMETALEELRGNGAAAPSWRRQ